MESSKAQWIKRRKEDYFSRGQKKLQKGTRFNDEERKEWTDVAGQNWTFITKPVRETVMNQMRSIAGKGNHIELAAGQIQHIPNSTVVDYTPLMLKKNPADKRLLFDLKKLAEGKQLPFEEGSFKSASMVFGINYFTKEQEHVLKEMARLVGNEGKVMIAGGEFYGHSELSRDSFNPDSLKKKFEKIGLKAEIITVPGGNGLKIIVAGKKLDSELMKEQMKLFTKSYVKREREENKLYNYRLEKLKTEGPYQSTTDYWQAREITDGIKERIAKEIGVKVKINLDEHAINSVTTEKQNKTAVTPWQVSFGISVPNDTDERMKKRIEWITKQEISKVKQHPSFSRVSTEKQFNEKTASVSIKGDIESAVIKEGIISQPKFERPKKGQSKENYHEWAEAQRAEKIEARPHEQFIVLEKDYQKYVMKVPITKIGKMHKFDYSKARVVGKLAEEVNQAIMADTDFRAIVDNPVKIVTVPENRKKAILKEFKDQLEAEQNFEETYE